MIFVITVWDVIFFGLAAIISVVAFVFGIRQYWIQRRCPHRTYGETAACHAICHQCGKDLGFIKHLRDRDEREGNKHE